MEINLHKFPEAVAEMRRLQIAFFKEKEKPLLQQAKNAEKRADNMLRQVGVGPAPVDKQTSLFE